MVKPTLIARFALPALLGAALVGGAPRGARGRDDQRTGRASIGVAAYLYFYPLVTMDLTRKQLTNVAKAEGISRTDEHVRQHSGISRRRT